MKTLIVRTDNEEATRYALLIDSTHSALFHMYFGWRGTYTKNGVEYMRFIFTNRDYYMWCKLIDQD